MPEDDNVALDLLRATPPLSRECFPARLGTARKLVNRILSDASNPRRCFRFRSGVVEAIADANQLRPGAVMVIDAVHPVCRARIVHEDPRDRAVDVYELTDDGSEPHVVRIVASDEQNDPCRRILAAVSGIIGDVTPSLSAVMPGLSCPVLDQFERQRRPCGRARVELHEKSRRNPEGERPEWKLAC